jgi:hypothetical protein
MTFDSYNVFADANSLFSIEEILVVEDSVITRSCERAEDDAAVIESWFGELREEEASVFTFEPTNRGEVPLEQSGDEGDFILGLTKGFTLKRAASILSEARQWQRDIQRSKRSGDAQSREWGNDNDVGLQQILSWLLEDVTDGSRNQVIDHLSDWLVDEPERFFGNTHLSINFGGLRFDKRGDREFEDDSQDTSSDSIVDVGYDESQLHRFVGCGKDEPKAALVETKFFDHPVVFVPYLRDAKGEVVKALCPFKDSEGEWTIRRNKSVPMMYVQTLVPTTVERHIYGPHLGEGWDVLKTFELKVSKPVCMHIGLVLDKYEMELAKLGREKDRCYGKDWDRFNKLLREWKKLIHDVKDLRQQVKDLVADAQDVAEHDVRSSDWSSHLQPLPGMSNKQRAWGRAEWLHKPINLMGRTVNVAVQVVTFNSDD